MYLFHRTAGVFNLNDLVTGTSDEMNTWILESGGGLHLTERDARGGTTGFPCLATKAYDTRIGWGCLLVPVK